jgi:cellulose synthase/poly-beta-1,6-N-acetylglucosamine synthase-like glycosyltransferase
VTGTAAPAHVDGAAATSAPWTFLWILGAAAMLVAMVGVDPAIVVASVTVNLAFLVFFLRHVAFASAAVRWAPRDLYAEAEVDLEYRPNVSVLVACHNEALVAESLVRGLRALHYPRSRLEVVLVDDGSTDGTGDLLESRTGG